MTSARRLIAVTLVLALAFAMVGCKKEPEAPVLDPKIAPPVISTAGVIILCKGINSKSFTFKNI